MVHQHDAVAGRGRPTSAAGPLPRLGISLGAILAVLTAEVVVGLRAHSLALVGDAVHLATDAASLGLALYATAQARRRATPWRTYGFHRTGTLVAVLNGAALLVVAAGLAAAAAGRLRQPPAIDAAPVLVTALVALGVSGGVVALLAGAGGDLGVRSAVLHAAADGLASAGVVAAAGVTLATGWRQADAVASLLIAVLIAAGAAGLLREALHILAEATPRGLDAAAVRQLIVATPGVLDVHDLHIWSLDRRHRILSAHVEVPDVPLGELTRTLQALEAALCERFGIEHATLQPECPACVTPADAWCDLDERHRAHHHDTAAAGGG